MTKNNSHNEYPLSLGEQKLIEQIRDMQDKNSSIPMHVIVRYHEGIWQLYQTIPAGHVKDKT